MANQRTRKSGWSPERRARQAAAIHRWTPWTKSTGPRTLVGKAVSSRNAATETRRKISLYREAVRAALAEADRLIRHSQGRLRGRPPKHEVDLQFWETRLREL
jgi:hypothetical protein